MPGFWREIRAGKEWSALVVEEDAHRPAAVAGHRHGGIHINGVDVGAFFPVDLDRHEVLI